MKQLLFFRIFSCILSVLLFFSNSLNAQEESLVKDTLMVGISGSEPFIFEEDSNYGQLGIAIEIWEEIAERKG